MTSNDLPPRTVEQELQYQAYLLAKAEYDKHEAVMNAAPDMLEALLAAEELYKTGMINASDELIDRVHTSRRAAIAKAYGTSHDQR